MKKYLKDEITKKICFKFFDSKNRHNQPEVELSAEKCHVD